MGAGVGASVGSMGGAGVGASVGAVVGFAVGSGVTVGCGAAVGTSLGCAVGSALGVGVRVGVGVGVARGSVTPSSFKRKPFVSTASSVQRKTYGSSFVPAPLNGFECSVISVYSSACDSGTGVGVGSGSGSGITGATYGAVFWSFVSSFSACSSSYFFFFSSSSLLSTFSWSFVVSYCKSVSPILTVSPSLTKILEIAFSLSG